MRRRYTASMVTMLVLGAAACADDGGQTDSDGETAGDGDGDPGDGDPGDGDPGDGDGDPGDGDGDPGDGDPGDGDGDPAAGFSFAASPADQYTRVDRVGVPMIINALITSKDEYNLASPAADANGDFAAEIIANLTMLHQLLDDDMLALGLVPCEANPACVQQVGPLIFPDTLKLDLDGPAGFPNGRHPTDPVLDVLWAAMLLDFTVPDQDPAVFVGLFNPPANDVAFSTEFPYLAPPN